VYISGGANISQRYFNINVLINIRMGKISTGTLSNGLLMRRVYNIESQMLLRKLDRMQVLIWFL
jgi:hypothetical protein